MRVICDIETDDLQATVIHVVVCINVDTEEVWHTTDPEEFREYAKGITEFIGHNFLSFDARWIGKLWDIHIPISKITDTLIMSQMHEPDRKGGHSLKMWGERFKFPKGDFTDFAKYSEEMLEYCIQDCRVTLRMYRYLLNKMTPWSLSSIRLEHQVRAIIDQQQINGFPVHEDQVSILLAKFQDIQHNLTEEVQQEFYPLCKQGNTMALKTTKSGEFNRQQLQWYKDDTSIVSGDFTKVTFEEFNLASRKQIGNHLQHHGWKPKEFTETGQAIVDEGTLDGVDIPQAQLICRYLKVGKLIGYCAAWLKALAESGDGRIHGGVRTLGTISNRMSHNNPNIGQVPSVSIEYGKECRECFHSGDDSDYVLFGTDASGLELRCLAHYMNDPAYTKEILTGDVHTANMLAAGLTERDQAKTFIYAWLYGGGAAKIGSIVGGSLKVGQKLIKDFLTATPALKKLKEAVAKAAKQPYIKGLDGRLLLVRAEYAALNQLLQGAGAIICKQWLVQIMLMVMRQKLRVKLVASIHDEYQFIVHKDDVQAMGIGVKEAIREVERILKVNCPLDCDWAVGKSWAETH